MQSKATHIVGGEIYYEHTGGDTYLITLKVYRDCGPTNTNGTDFDDFASVGIFEGGALFTELVMELDNAEVNFIPVALENPCFVLPPDVCVEQATYQELISLPPSALGYDLVYQRCCRNPSIVNIDFPEDSGATFWTQIPSTGQTTESNSCPQFDFLPPVALCTNAAFVFDHGATDIDGDSLAYTFCTPMLGGTPDLPAPAPPNAPPFFPVQWAAGYSVDYPIASDPPFNINAQTGLITGTANLPGQYVIGICVEEWRDGILLSTTNRDFQFNVTICDPNVVVSIPEQTQFCDGLTFEFSQESEGADDFYWDFGDPNSEDDWSIEPNPSYTYSDTGVYEVTLIANPGWECADTSLAEYLAYPLIIPVILQSDFSCFNGQTLYDFQASGDYDSDATFSWDFGINASDQFSEDQNPQDISFGGAEEFEVSLTVFDNGCEETSTETYVVPAEPVAEVPAQMSFCEGLSFTFDNLSENSDSYLWNFGDPNTTSDFSSEFEPTYTYPDTGTYVVTLISSADFTCPDTTTTLVEIFWLLDPYFETPPSQCFDGNSFSFMGEGTVESTAVYNWEFGPTANPENSNAQNTFGVEYQEPGIFDVTLTIEANGCVDSYSSFVEVVPNPIIGHSITNAEGCPTLQVHFSDESITTVPLQYEWDFGDGSTSALPNPIHAYSTPGMYDISLSITSTSGCVETLSLFEPDAVWVYPVPSAGFDVEPNTVNVLDPVVTIEDLSKGGVDCQYFMSDGGSSDQCELIYTFSEAGIIDINQTVTNSFGCKDYAHGQVAVEGYLFYAPNSFTPDGDGTNEVWLPQVWGAKEYELQIFNRWGDIIFYTENPEEPWLGNVDNGEHYVADGVYLYHVIIHDLLSYPHEYFGHITVFR